MPPSFNSKGSGPKPDRPGSSDSKSNVLLRTPPAPSGPSRTTKDVAHEIKNQVDPIYMYAALLLRAAENHPGQEDWKNAGICSATIVGHTRDYRDAFNNFRAAPNLKDSQEMAIHLNHVLGDARELVMVLTRIAPPGSAAEHEQMGGASFLGPLVLGLEQVFGQYRHLFEKPVSFIDPTPERLDLRKELEFIFASFEAKLNPTCAKNWSIGFEQVCPSPGVFVVNLPPALLRSVLFNLLSNAQKYGGRQISLRVQSDPSSVRILVQDDGKGLTPAQQALAFQAPFRDSRRSDSSGEGLMICRECIALIPGASLRALAPDQNGGLTTFEIRLPRALPSVDLEFPFGVY